jgi:hypothetical protein
MSKRKTTGGPKSAKIQTYNGRQYIGGTKAQIAIADRAVEQTTQLVKDWLADEFIVMIGHYMSMNEIIIDLRGYIRRTPGPLVRIEKGQRIYPAISEVEAGNLNKHLTEFCIIAARNDMQPPPGYVNHVIEVVNGIKDLLTSADKGERLRATVMDFETPDQTSAQNWIASKKKPGPKVDSVLNWICERFIHVLMSREEYTHETAYQAMLEAVLSTAPIDELHRQAQERLNTHDDYFPTVQRTCYRQEPLRALLDERKKQAERQ